MDLGWTQRFGHDLDRDTPHPDTFALGGVGYGGIPARVGLRRDLINLCQNSWDALQAPWMAL